MTRQRYNVTESWNRILRLFQGKAIPTDVPGVVTGDVLPVEKALSDLTELLGGSLPNETAELPASLVATVDEANADTSTINTRAMTPASHQWAHEYGGIYTSTGTTPISLVANTWTKLTGTFKSYMLDSGSEVDCDWNDDRIVINEVGTYMVAYQNSLLCRGDSATIELESFVNGSEQPQTRSSVTYGASGTVDGSKSLSGYGFVSIVSGTYAIDLRARASVATIITTQQAQLTAQRAVG